jgi:hypothetical protein
MAGILSSTLQGVGIHLKRAGKQAKKDEMDSDKGANRQQMSGR